MQPLPLWPVMMYDFQWAEHKTYKDRLKEVCRELEQQKQTSGVAVDAKRGLYESGFDFLKTPDPAVEMLGHYLKDCFFKSAANANKDYWPKGLNVTLEIHESWCHITRDGGYHDMHTHPGSSWSCVYYLDCAEMDARTKNGLNRFYCPYDNMYTDAGTAWTGANTSIDINAQEGMVLIFPSWVQHSGLLYRGQQERYVIAANCKINRTDMTNVTLPI